MQIIPMSVEQALKAAETYRSPTNGDMVSVLADEVRRLREAPRDPKSLLEYFDNAAAFTQFAEYVIKNYPPNCVIGDPAWHAPKLWRQALYALTMNPRPLSTAVAPQK
jgi:hypothetical protein